MDAGRIADLKLIQQRLNDPKTTPAQRKKLEETAYQIRHQAGFATVSRDRERLIKASQSGDQKTMEEISAKLGRFS